MERNLKNSGSEPNRLFGRLAAEKKKTVTALCLIAVIVVMWTRLIASKTPASAEAAPADRQQNNDTSASNLESKISFIKLPEIEGRNDVLTRDFFASNGWHRFFSAGESGNSAGIEGVNAVSKNGSEELARRVAKKLKLEAIVLSETPQAFINDKLLSVGDKFSVRDGNNVYECEVIAIEKNSVVISCGEVEIKLKLT